MLYEHGADCGNAVLYRTSAALCCCAVLHERCAVLRKRCAALQERCAAHERCTVMNERCAALYGRCALLCAHCTAVRERGPVLHAHCTAYYVRMYYKSGTPVRSSNTGGRPLGTHIAVKTRWVVQNQHRRRRGYQSTSGAGPLTVLLFQASRRADPMTHHRSDSPCSRRAKCPAHID